MNRTPSERPSGPRALPHLAAAFGLVLLAALGGCGHMNASFNEPLPPPPTGPDAPPPPRPRATLDVDGGRGNPKALVLLALSGGGSRAAYLSAATMARWRTLYPDFDLLAEVDAISSVSGGSIAGAYYAGSRDEELFAPALAARLAASGAGLAPLSLHGGSAGPRLGPAPAAGPPERVRCARAEPGALRTLEATLAPHLSGHDLARVMQLCAQAAITNLRVWRDDDALARMRRNYLWRWFGNWLWPFNAVKYWFTGFDRSDLMAQTLEDNLFDTPILGFPIKLRELNPARPYLIVNATNATAQNHADGSDDEFPFGSVFTFTHEDFDAQLKSDIGSYSLARAVMASSAFPLVFANMTLRDYRETLDKDGPPRYLHVFDGGNSDNLGLRSLKRVLFQMHLDDKLRQYDRIVVLQIDAFTRPGGAARDDPDPRNLLSLLLDTNATDAVDSLLLANRQSLLREFDAGRLGWTERDCSDEARHLPLRLCDALARKVPGRELDLSDKLVFYHFGFADVLPEKVPLAPRERRELKARLDNIPTSFSLAERHARDIDRAVEAVIRPDNGCLVALRTLLLAPAADAPRVAAARLACHEEEGRPDRSPATGGAGGAAETAAARTR